MRKRTRNPARDLRTALVLCGAAAASVLCGLEVVLGLAQPFLSTSAVPFVLLGLLLGAVAAGLLARRARTRRALVFALLAGLIPLAFLRLDPVGLALVAALAHAGLLLVGAGLGGPDEGARLSLLRAALATTALAALFAPAAAPHVLWLAVVPMVVALVLVIASLAQLVSGRADALAGTPPALRARLVGAGGGDDSAPRTPGLHAVARDVVPALLALALWIPILALLLESLPDPSLNPTPLDGFSARPDGAADDEATSAGEGRAPFDGVFPDGAPLGGPPRTIRHEEVMWVRTRPGYARGLAQPIGPVYLRGNTLERFVANGLEPARARTPRRLADEDDGRRDGWTTLRSGWTQQDLVLEIEQSPLYLEGSSWSLLFAPAGLRAIDTSPIEWEADQLLAALDLPADGPEGRHVYRLRTVERRGERLDLSNARIALGPRELTRLPPGKATTQLRARARAIAADARSPEERLAAVLAFLRNGFVYDLRTEHPPGLSGVLTFLERRRGFCTTYASATVALLRALDVPARVATGFCASEWIDAAEAYRVTTAQGHAWVEVLYDELGWVVFDPTPQLDRQRELASSARAPAEDIGDWGAELLHDLRRWQALGDEQSWDELLETMTLFPAALIESAGKRPALLLLPVGVVLAWFLWRRRRARVAAAAAMAPVRRATRRSAADPLEERLVATLARWGTRRRPADPLLGLSRRAAAREPDLGEAPRLAGWLQRARFGALPLTAAESRTAEDLLNAWEQAGEVSGDDSRDR